MPKENVERAIKKATEKDTANYKEVLFEGYAPHGIALLIETATDNNNRTVANIRSYFNKCNGTMGTQGSVEFMFDHTCNFRIPKEGLDPEELELETMKNLQPLEFYFLSSTPELLSKNTELSPNQFILMVLVGLVKLIQLMN